MKSRSKTRLRPNGTANFDDLPFLGISIPAALNMHFPVVLNAVLEMDRKLCGSVKLSDSIFRLVKVLEFLQTATRLGANNAYVNSRCRLSVIEHPPFVCWNSRVTAPSKRFAPATQSQSHQLVSPFLESFQERIRSCACVLVSLCPFLLFQDGNDRAKFMVHLIKRVSDQKRVADISLW